MGNGQSAAYHKLLTHMRNNHVAKFKKVLKECAHYRNFDLNHPVEKDKSLLAIACAENREEMVLAILDSKVLRIKDNITSTLFFAVENGQPNILKILLSRNETDPNAMKNKQTALHVAVQKGSYTSCLLLLKFGADPNIQNGKGQTALHLAAQVQRQDLAELILRQSNIINVKLDDVQDNRDRSPRDVLINRFPKIDLLPQIESEEILALSKYLQLGQEEKFCEAFQEVKTIDTDDLKKLIKMAVHNGQQMALAELLKREKSLFIDMTKVFDDALDRGDHQVLKMLLDRKVLLRNDYDVLLRAAQLLGVPCEMEDRFPGARFECLKLIAEHQNVSIRHEYYQTAKKEDTPLYWANMWACSDAINLMSMAEKNWRLMYFATSSAADVVRNTDVIHNDDCPCCCCCCCEDDTAGNSADCDCGDCGDGGDCGDCNCDCC